jgi:hypothetical protein
VNTFGEDDAVVDHNTCYNNGLDTYGSYAEFVINDTANCQLTNNIGYVSAYDHGLNVWSSTNLTTSNNTYWPNGVSVAQMGSGDLYGNPLFLNPNGSPPDFSVSATGPGAGRGAWGTYGGGGSPAFVQVNSAAQTSSSSMAVSYNSAQTAGDLNIVAAGWGDTTANVSSVTDSLGNTYTLAAGPTSGTGLRQVMYYATNIKAGSNTVTVNFTTSANYPDVRILEYAGVSTLDVTASATGNSATPSCGPVTTTAASELVFATDTAGPSNSGPGAGYTQRVIDAFGSLAEDEIASSTGSYSASASLQSSGDWVIQMATFKSGGGSPPPAPAGLTATPGNAQVALSWNASSGATAYDVKRSTVSGSGYATVSSPTTTSFTNTGLTNGATYYFVVDAKNANGTSANSSQVSATPVAPPAAPTGLSATAGNAQVALSWTASSGATSYTVQRSTVNGSGYATVATSITSTSYTNTGLTNGTTYYFVVQAVNAGGTSGNSNQASATPASGGTSGPVKINCGGPAVSPFVADVDFSGGTAATNWTGAIDTSAVTSPAPQSVYQSERWGASTYTMGGLTAGSNYTVRLHFCENYFTASGQRAFNVAINGTTVLTSFDIYAKAGAAHKANIQQFNAAANGSGQIVVAFTNVTNNALINGIEVIAAFGPSNKINGGGPAVSPFVADVDFSGGTAATNWTGTIDTSAVTAPAPQAVYQSERWGASTYTIPGYAANSSHTVRLHFCENYFSASGQRVFNVAINGTTVLTNFDIFARTGAAHKGNIQEFAANANGSGQYVVSFTNVTNNALINGIEVN